MEGGGARMQRLARGALLWHYRPLLAEGGSCTLERGQGEASLPLAESPAPLELATSVLLWGAPLLLLLLFGWHCHRVGRVPPGDGHPAPQGTPPPAPETPSPRNGRYARLREYARLYSWAGVGRVRRALREGEGGAAAERPGIQRPGLLYLPELPSAPYLPRDTQRHDVELLEGHYPLIARECERARREMAGGWAGRGGWGWHTFHLYQRGVWVPGHCRACPRTYRALTTLRSFIGSNSLGEACFALLQPGTALQGQYGLTNARLRCQLGLKTPPGCELVVGGEPQCWSEGHCLLVDDSFLHSITHN
ncbi:hypothetical protein chiPu_0022523, partial [Chiloscyllium punctatum]|nr:hypothetical protein [Chiloscyllium punctatum]